MKKTIASMLADAAQEFSAIPYVLRKTDNGWHSRTFQEVHEEARHVSAALIDLGLAPEDRVAVLGEGSPEWVIGELATLLVGAISVPLSIKLLVEEIPFRLNHSGARAIFVSKNQLKKVLSVWEQIEQKPLLLYLDEDEAHLEAETSAAGLQSGQYVSYAELVRRGKDRFAALSKELEKRVDAIGEETVATISYTSGTTGNPKGIMLTHKNYYVNVQDSVTVFDVPRASYTTLLILPCDHSFGHTVGIYAGLARAITIYFVDSRGGGLATLRNIPANLKEAGPVFLLTVPALTGNFMKKIIQGAEEQGSVVAKLFHAGIRAGIHYYGDCYHKPGILTKIRHFFPYKTADLLIFRKARATFGNRIEFCVGGGALLDEGQQQFFRALGIPVYQGYGLTEAAPVISSNTQFAHKIGTSGQVLPSVTCKVVDEDGNEVANGVRGEIVIRGENVMKGYFRNPDATAEALRDGWLHTGDLGFLDADGFLCVTGREKALLISSDGEKYSPEEIEEAIVSSSQVISQVMIYNDHCKYTSALVTVDRAAVRKLAQSRQIADADELLDAIREEFFLFRKTPAYKDRFPTQWIPSVFQILPEQFSEENRTINSSMKLVRFKVLEMHRDIIEYMYNSEGGKIHNKRNREIALGLLEVIPSP